MRFSSPAAHNHSRKVQHIEVDDLTPACEYRQHTGEGVCIVHEHAGLTVAQHDKQCPGRRDNAARSWECVPSRLPLSQELDI